MLFTGWIHGDFSWILNPLDATCISIKCNKSKWNHRSLLLDSSDQLDEKLYGLFSLHQIHYR